ERRPSGRRLGRHAPGLRRLRADLRRGRRRRLPPGRALPLDRRRSFRPSPQRMPNTFVTRLTFMASNRPEAQEGRERLIARYGEAGIDEAQVIVALGGDGFMLETVHELMERQLPIYGMNRGSVGFLMNEYNEDDLLGRINAAEQAVIHPLRM